MGPCLATQYVMSNTEVLVRTELFIQIHTSILNRWYNCTQYLEYMIIELD